MSLRAKLANVLQIEIEFDRTHLKIHLRAEHSENNVLFQNE